MKKTFYFVGMDFYLIKPYMGSIFFLLAMGIGMGLGFRSTGTLSSYYMMSLMLVMSYPFSVGEKNGLDTLYGTLSMSRKTMVEGRYFFAFILEVLCAAFAFISGWVLSRFLHLEFIPQNEFFTLSLLSCIFSVIVAIQYPLYFKLGYNKAKIIALFPLFALFLLVIQMPTLANLFGWAFTWESLFESVLGNPLLMYAAPVFTGIIALLLSCSVSERIYTGRDI